jgi:hypothetical protein
LPGVDPDELRALLRAEIEEAEHELMQAVLAEAWAASASVAPAADGPETTPGPHQQRIQRRSQPCVRRSNRDRERRTLYRFLYRPEVTSADSVAREPA